MAVINTPLPLSTLARCAVTACLLVITSRAVLGEDRAITFPQVSGTASQSQQGRAKRFDVETTGIPRRDSSSLYYPTNHETPIPQGDQRRVAVESRSTISPTKESPEGPATPPYSPPEFGEQTDFRALLSRVFLATVGVLIACCASIWLAKRYVKQPGGKPCSDGSLKLLATLSVSRRGCVQLIQADDTRLVVAVDGGALKSVIPLTDSFAKEFLGELEDADAEGVQLTKPKRKII